MFAFYETIFVAVEVLLNPPFGALVEFGKLSRGDNGLFAVFHARDVRDCRIVSFHCATPLL